MKHVNAALLIFSLLLGFSFSAYATVVRFETTAGDFDVELYDDTTPLTVANFLSYVNAMDYDSSIIHRFALRANGTSFVAQGGGFQYEDSLPVTVIAKNDPVENEPVHSNVLGTIAMAKLPGEPDSATSQWFFNLDDNSATLDTQDGGFTVFGELLNDGIDIVDALRGDNIVRLSDPSFRQLPLRCYTPTDFSRSVDVTVDNLILVHRIYVVDLAVDSAPSGMATPVPCPPRPTPTPVPSPAPSNNSDGGGGAIGYGLLYLMLLIGSRRFSMRRTF